jgi:DNA-binding NarL/FixJ family response regulator
MKRNADSRERKTAGVGGTPPYATPAGADLLTDIAWSEIARSLELSARELETVRGVFDNLTEDAIAGNLGVYEHTIHTHLHRLFSKLRVTTRTQMVVRIMQELLLLTLSEAGSLPSICRHRANGRCPMEN